MATTYQPWQWLMPANTNINKVGNYSFDFDGTGDLIDCGDDATLQITGPMTISYWFKGKGTTASISGVGKNGATRGYSLGLDDDATHSDFTVTSDKVLATSTVMVCSNKDVDIRLHSVIAGSFKLGFTNKSGAALGNDSTIIFNYTII